MRRLATCAVVPTAKARLVRKIQIRIERESIFVGYAVTRIGLGRIGEYRGIDAWARVEVKWALRPIILRRLLVGKSAVVIESGNGGGEPIDFVKARIVG